MSVERLYIDLETAGLHGMPVLLQYAVEDGPITLYDIWKHPIGETLDLIEWMLTYTIVGFNLAFDMLHVAKCYTTFRLCPRDWVPEQHIDEVALKEPEAQDGPCLKPASALDLMLHSRKTKYQSLMARDDVRIRKVPTVLAYALAEELERRVQIDGIYFAKTADPEAPRWGVFDRKNKDGEIDDQFKDVVLKFSPAGGLKFLAEYALKLKPKYHYNDVEPDPAWRPIELGYAPTALAISTLDRNWEVHKRNAKGEHVLAGYAWPGVIRRFIDHWATHQDARDYARDDIVYTRALDEHFGYPEPGDDDSVLACMVAAVRWHGFTIDVPGVKTLLEAAREVVARSPVNINRPPEVRRYVAEVMDVTETTVSKLDISTKKANLEAVAEWTVDEPEPCSRCEGADPNCVRCDGMGQMPAGLHPAARRSKEILSIKFAAKEIELYTKLLRAGKFHASFVVIGALSSRMAGADGLNAQGIKHTKEVRRMFPLAWAGMILCGGDFAAFEVTIADAVCNDEALRAELLAGKKIHALFGMALFPDRTYEEIKASDGTDNDMYTKGKQGFFGTMLYGGDHSTLINKLGIREDIARAAIESFGKRFVGVKRWRKRIADAFCSMRQPDGIGTRVVWQDPADFCETFLGFRRYFTLENAICKELFSLATRPPKYWRELGSKVKVVRRDRVQTAGGAVASALYGSAFAMQAANMRAAANHEIQSPGAEITKSVQRKVWDLQPCGVNDWRVAAMNIHDELMCVTYPDEVANVTAAVTQAVEAFRSKVPLIGVDWCEGMANWAEKKSGTIKIRAPEMMN